MNEDGFWVDENWNSDFSCKLVRGSRYPKYDVVVISLPLTPSNCEQLKKLALTLNTLLHPKGK